jgi:hypothetical protein
MWTVRLISTSSSESSYLVWCTTFVDNGSILTGAETTLDCGVTILVSLGWLSCIFNLLLSSSYKKSFSYCFNSPIFFCCMCWTLLIISWLIFSPNYISPSDYQFGISSYCTCICPAPYPLLKVSPTVLPIRSCSGCNDNSLKKPANLFIKVFIYSFTGTI